MFLYQSEGKNSDGAPESRVRVRRDVYAQIVPSACLSVRPLFTCLPSEMFHLPGFDSSRDKCSRAVAQCCYNARVFRPVGRRFDPGHILLSIHERTSVLPTCLARWRQCFEHTDAPKPLIGRHHCLSFWRPVFKPASPPLLISILPFATYR